MSQVDTTSEAIDSIMQGCSEVLIEDELKARLKEGKPLRVKLGLDPSSADLHLGHTVVINKLRAFQQAGHHVILLVGSFTACIGDPTGKNVTRQPLTDAQVEANAQTYQDQVFKILDPKKTQVVNNRDWLGAMTAADMIALAAKSTVARMLERDDFSKRHAAQQPIGIHEFMYPLLQGQDSVELKADVEIGGTDQKFNLLMGRELQKQQGMPTQSVMMMPLLVGLDGHKKMSKSLGNAIGITDAPEDMFGKVMSISDELMWHYYALLSLIGHEAVAALKASVASGANPRDIKVALAMELVARFHSDEAAEQAHAAFIARFKQGALPDDLVLHTLMLNEARATVPHILKELALVSGTSEGMRMIKQGAVKLDGVRVLDAKQPIEMGVEQVIQVGKRRVAKFLLKNA